MRVAAACILALGLVGCMHGVGWYDLQLASRWTHAEPPRVYLKGESALPLSPELKSEGLVSGSFLQPRDGRTAQGACNSVMDEAIVGLLRKAEQLGGNSIREMEARGPRDWLAELVCRIRPGKYPFSGTTVRVRLRALAVYDPAVGTPGAAVVPVALPTSLKDSPYERFLYACRTGDAIPHLRGAKRKKMCGDLDECLSGYTMSRRPEATRNGMCAEKLRNKHPDIDALMEMQ